LERERDTEVEKNSKITGFIVFNSNQQQTAEKAKTQQKENLFRDSHCISLLILLCMNNFSPLCHAPFIAKFVY
jgi:hypothetical protein